MGQGCHNSCDTHVGLAAKLQISIKIWFWWRRKAFFVLLILRDKTEGSYPFLILILENNFQLIKELSLVFTNNGVMYKIFIMVMQRISQRGLPPMGTKGRSHRTSGLYPTAWIMWSILQKYNPKRIMVFMQICKVELGGQPQTSHHKNLNIRHCTRQNSNKLISRAFFAFAP